MLVTFETFHPLILKKALIVLKNVYCMFKTPLTSQLLKSNVTSRVPPNVFTSDLTVDGIVAGTDTNAPEFCRNAFSKDTILNLPHESKRVK